MDYNTQSVNILKNYHFGARYFPENLLEQRMKFTYITFAQ